MKDKLRELAEMVREAYRAGFIAACKWPAPVSQDVDSSAYNREFNSWSFSVREKHAAILDAEGDGEVVATAASMRAELVAKIGDCCMGGDPFCAGGCLAEKAAKRNAERAATNPARSGVVSEEMVAAYVAAVNEHLGNMTENEWQADRLDKHAHLARVARIGLTAALESYERNRK